MDRVTADARSDHQWHDAAKYDSQALGEVDIRLVDVFLRQLIPRWFAGWLSTH